MLSSACRTDCRLEERLGALEAKIGSADDQTRAFLAHSTALWLSGAGSDSAHSSLQKADAEDDEYGPIRK
jgi:hypothetical protein